MKYREGTCCVCQDGDNWKMIVKRTQKGDYCYPHNKERLRAIKREPLRPGSHNHMNGARERAVAKGTDNCQSLLFDTIWATRVNGKGERVSAISGTVLRDFYKTNGKRGAMWYSQFFHILPKGTYPAYKCTDKNLLLTTIDEHIMWHQRRDKCAADPAWDFVFKRYQELQLEDSLANKVG